MSPASLLGCEKINIYYINKVQAVANKTKVGDGGAGREAGILEKTVFPRTLRDHEVLRESALVPDSLRWVSASIQTFCGPCKGLVS